MFEPSVLTVMEPVVYTPPPPPPPAKPSSTVPLNRCSLCVALVEYGFEQRHKDWHLVNGLHGAGCDLLVSMMDRPTGGELRACSCGLVEKEKES